MERFWKALLACPALFATMLVVSDVLVAQETPARSEITEPLVVASPERFENSSQNKASMWQVNSVSQLSDVQPSDRPSVRQKSLIQKSKVQKRYKPLNLFMENEKYVFRDA